MQTETVLIVDSIEQPLLEEPKVEAPKEEDMVKKFAKWLIIHTNEVQNTAGACRRYKRKVYNVDELFDIFEGLQIK
jgi:hypothetical protein